MKLEGRFWITHNGKNLAGQGRIELLSRINDSGSISQAAKAMGMSYKSAWDAVDAMNNAAGSPLVERSAGGKGGGGTRLTDAGLQLIAAFRRYQEEHERFLAILGQDGGAAPYLKIMDRLRLRTSARNQLLARIVHIETGDLNDLVALELQGGLRLSASITHASTERLGLKVDDEIFALIKAGWVELSLDPATDALNSYRAQIQQIEHGARDTEVQLQLAGGLQVTALLTANELALQTGLEVTLRIEPSQVILCTL